MLRPSPTKLLAMLCLFCLLAGAMTRCTSRPVQPYVATEPRNEAIYVIVGGWHTELALPMPAISGRLAALKLGFGNARYLVFGWGPATITCNETPDLGICCERPFRPAVLLVIPLQASPETFAGAANTFALPVSHGDADRLSQFLWGYVAKDAEGTPRRIGAGPYPGSVFYASTGTFDLAHTCNTWTVEALRAAGLTVSSAHVVYAGQLLDQLQPPAPGTPRHNGSKR